MNVTLTIALVRTRIAARGAARRTADATVDVRALQHPSIVTSLIVCVMSMHTAPVAVMSHITSDDAHHHSQLTAMCQANDLSTYPSSSTQCQIR